MGTALDSSRSPGGIDASGRQPSTMEWPPLEVPSWTGITPSGEPDKRQCPRRSLRCGLRMVDVAVDGESGPVIIAGMCVNISRDGLYALVPIGYGVNVGQTYLFHLSLAELGPEPGSHRIVSQKGRVVRIDLLSSGENHQLGIGVRLTGPRTGMVPMPS